jgi:PAS domain S-box-containing protein
MSDERRGLVGEDHFRQALTAARMDAFEWDPSTDRVTRTLGKELLLGEDASALGSTGREYFDRIHPDDRPAFMAALEALAPERPELLIDYRFLAPSGRWLWLKDSARGEFDAAGTLLRLRGVTADVTELRRAHEELRDREDRLRLALEVADTGLWTWDVRTDAVTWSPECYRIHGLAEGEFERTGAAFFALVHPDDRERVGRTVRAAVAGRGPYECEFRIVRPDGDVAWVSNRGRASYDASGAPVRMLGTITDVGVRKRAEEELRRTRGRADFLAKAIDDASQPFGVGAPDGRLVLFNRAFVELTGYTEEELKSESWSNDLTPPEWREHEAEVLAELHRTGAPLLYEKEYLRKDGTRVPIEIKVHLTAGEDGGPLYYAFVTDLTERKRAEAALRRSEAIHRKLAEANLFGVGFGTSTGGVSYVNDEMLRMMGRTREDFEAGRIDWAECLAPESRETIATEAGRVLSEGQASGYEAAFLRPDGGRTPYLAAAALVTPGEDFHVSIALDLTPVRSVERRREFLAGLGERLRDLPDVAAVADEATRSLGAYLGVAQVGYGVIDHDEAGALVMVERDWNDGRIASVVGTWRMDDFGPEFVSDMKGGRTVAIPDVTRDPRTGAPPVAAAYEGIGTRAILDVPLVKDGRMVALLFVHHPEPRDWTPGDVAVAEEVAERLWAAVGRARAEAALRESEERFRLMADSIDHMVWVTRPDGYHEYYNRRWYEYTGVPDGSTDGEAWNGMFHPDDQERAWDRWRRSLASGEDYEIEYRLRHHGGEYRWNLGRARPLRDAEGRIVKWFGTCTDIHDFKLTQEALGRREREFRTLADNTPDILSRYDRELRHLFVNAAVEKATGLRAERFIGRTNRELGMPSHLCDLWDAAIRRAFEHGQPEGVEFRYDAPDRTRHFSSRFVPEFGPCGEVESVLGVTADVTERKQMEEALRDADRRKDEFLATLAHELRNPLAPIRNGLQILRMAGGDPGVTETAREMMERQLAHMVRLVDDLLDISRVSRGKVELRRERVALKSVIDNAVEASRPFLESGRHTLSVTLPDEVVYLDGDPTRLAQVVGNLLNNAAKYTPDGGHVELSAAVESGRAVIRVRDDGSGIPAEMLPHIFEMFTQVGRTLDRAQGGLGIGLSLVKRLAEMHGGSIVAESPGVGLGSTFTVRLPVATPPSDKDGNRPPRRRPGRRTDGPSYRVLVVDDSEDSARSFAMVLELNGHEPRVVHDGPEALRVAPLFAPDVVFLDIGMPVMDGYEVCRRLRASELGPRLTIVALTGWGAEGDKERTRAAGFDLHLVKPVDPDRIEAVLRELGRRAGPREAHTG